MSPEVLGQLLPIAVLVLLLYLLVIRPARKRAHKVSQLQQALAVGEEVMLTSGIFGTVSSIADDRIQVTVADGVVLTCHRGAIAEIVRDVPAVDGPDHDPDEVSDNPEDPSDEPHDASSRGAN